MTVCALEPGYEFPTEHSAQDSYRKKEGIPWMNPALVIWRQAAGRDRAMDMRVMWKVLPPNVKHTEEADLYAEVPGIGGDFQKGDWLGRFQPRRDAGAGADNKAPIRVALSTCTRTSASKSRCAPPDVEPRRSGGSHSHTPDANRAVRLTQRTSPEVCKLLKMERETGLEPATSSLGSWHSTTELLPRRVRKRFSPHYTTELIRLGGVGYDVLEQDAEEGPCGSRSLKNREEHRLGRGTACPTKNTSLRGPMWDRRCSIFQSKNDPEIENRF